MSTLPTHILQALESLASAHQRTQLARAAEAVSSRYRRAQNDADTLQIRDEVEAAAYACARMPATYAAITRVLEAVGMTVPPRSMLDYGAGPGTATLAARALWPDVAAQMVEPNAAMRRVAKHLIGDADFRDTPTQADTVSPHRFRAIARSCGDTPDTDSHLMNENRYELVVAAYVLNEVGDPAALAEKLWGACGRILVLVDSGTPAAQAMMMQVRAQLLAAGAHLHAPCPHDLACPFAGPEGWCHFSTRLSRTRLHKALKGGALGYEDETFTYLVFGRMPAPSRQARIIGHPRARKVIETMVCTPAGAIETLGIAKSDARYKAARKARWGDVL